MKDYELHVHLMRSIAEKVLQDIEWRMMHEEKLDDAVILFYKNLKQEVECCDYLMNLSSSPSTRATIS